MLNNNYHYYIITILFSLICPRDAHSSGWDTFSKHDELKGLTIVEAADVSKIIPPPSVKWTVDLHKIGNQCLAFSNYNVPILYRGKAALLLVDSAGTTSLAIFKENVSSVEVKLYPVSLYKCPYGTTRLEHAKQVREFHKQQLKDMKLQQKKNKELWESIKQENY